ncbi:MAG: hypothetical protein ACREM6_00135 [Vulcanimicrobiaceae bacterium]
MDAVAPAPRLQRSPWTLAIGLLAAGTAVFVVGAVLDAVPEKPRFGVGSSLLIVAMVVMLAGIYMGTRAKTGDRTGPALDPRRMRPVVVGLFLLTAVLLLADVLTLSHPDGRWSRIARVAWLVPFAWFSIFRGQMARPTSGKRSSTRAGR